MKIYIPTFGRVDRQVTLAALPRGADPVLVAYSEETADLRKHGVEIVKCPAGVRGIGPKRHFILQHAKKNKVEKVLLLDDDLRFFRRSVDDLKRFIKADVKDVDRMIHTIDNLLSTYAHAHVRHREMAQEAKPLEFACRGMRATGLRVEEYFRAGCDYSFMPAMSDFDVLLTLLRAGHANAVTSMFVQDHGGSNSKGGMSAYRTSETLSRAANLLAERHPGFVKVVEKTTKGAWGGGTRTDVQIAWKKAFLSSGKELPC